MAGHRSIPVVVWLAACGTTPGATDDTRVDAEGWWCAGEGGCDAVWMCQPDTPCSAAPGFTACTCAGEYVALASGCPAEQYAYTDSFLPQRLLGTPCDPEAAGPVVRADLTLRGAGYSEYEGLNVGAVLIDNVTGTSEAPVFGRVADGAFELTWYDTFDRDAFGYFVRLFFEVGSADFVCGRGDSVVAVFVSNPFADDDPIVVEVTRELVSESSCP